MKKVVGDTAGSPTVQCWTSSQPLQNLVPTLPTMQQSDIIGGSLSGYVQLPMDPEKAWNFLP